MRGLSNGFHGISHSVNAATRPEKYEMMILLLHTKPDRQRTIVCLGTGQYGFGLAPTRTTMANE
jgi:hypothetical protein